MRRFSVTMVLLGLQRVGVVGLREALDEVDRQGPPDEGEAVDRLLEILARRNHIPDESDADYRRAIRREYLRHRGLPLEDCYADVEVTIRGAAGEERDAFLGHLESVLGALELRPIVHYEGPVAHGPEPQLLIGGRTVAYGPQSRESLKAAVQRTISDW